MALALSILWILAALLVMWAASLMWRGMFPRGRERRKLVCPSCGSVTDCLSCASCGYEGQSAKDFRRSRDWRLFMCGWIPVVAGVGAGYGAEVVRGWFELSFARGGAGLGPVQGIALGVALFALILGMWSYRGDRPRGRRRCPKCWYDMSGSQLLCPECGHDAKVVKRLYRPRRRWRGVLGSVVLLVASYGAWVTPRVIAGGPVGVAPSWLLIAGIEWLPESMIVSRGMPRVKEDWTLLGRWHGGKLWGFERWLLRWRGRSLLERGASATALRHVMPLLDVRDADLAVPTHLAMVRGLVSEKASERSAAAAVPYVWFAIDDHVRRAIEPYQERLFKAIDDPDPSVQAYAAWYLAEINADPKRLFGRVFDMIRAAPGGVTRFHGIWIPMMQGADEADAIILEASRDSSASVRIACTFVLGHEGTGEGVHRLIEMLDDADWRVAQAAADALAARGSVAVVPAMVNWWCRQTDLRLRFPLEIHGFGPELGAHMGSITDLLRADSTIGMRLLDQLTQRMVQLDYGPVIPVLKSLTESDQQIEADEAKRLLEVIELMKK